MSWFAWLLIVLWTIDPLLKIVLIGEPRKPVSKSDAIAGVVTSALLIWGVLVYFA